MTPAPAAGTPVIVPDTVATQFMVVEPMLDVGKKFNASPLQMTCVRLAGVLVMTGTGLTVTVTSSGAPGQPFAAGVMR